MSSVKIFWDPKGMTVDKLGTRKYERVTDGDTPYISMSIRMLSIDTPETHSNPSKHDESLAQLAIWIQEEKAPIKPDLGQYLIPKLETGNAGALQEQQGNKATAFLEKLIMEKLSRPGGDPRQLYIRAADEHFDQYGRLLAYISPYYKKEELESRTLKERATFNLMMIESGWAASFPIYPSIPSHPNLVLLQEAGKHAFENDLGAWADPLALTGYEFRMCVRLYTTTKKMVIDGKKLYGSTKYNWIERYCVDMTTREIFYPQDYYKVKPYNRIFIWPKDVVEAVSMMNLIPPK